MLEEHRGVGAFVEGVSRERFPEELILALSFEGCGGVALMKEERKPIRQKEHPGEGQGGLPIIQYVQSLVDECL